jgi:hypothetical protein
MEHMDGWRAWNDKRYSMDDQRLHMIKKPLLFTSVSRTITVWRAAKSRCMIETWLKVDSLKQITHKFKSLSEGNGRWMESTRGTSHNL